MVELDACADLPSAARDNGGTVAPDLSHSSVQGNLSCTGNASSPVLEGVEVTGRTSGQCAR